MNVRRFSSATIASVITLFVVATSVYIATLVGGAISMMASHGNEIDDQRALVAVDGAVQALRKQLSNTVRDNAYWDEAYEHMLLPSREQWAYETWGSVTKDYPLYDTALVLDPADKPFAAYRDGEKMSSPTEFLDSQLRRLVKDLRTTGQSNPVLTFAAVPDGVALVGFGIIRAQVSDVNSRDAYILVLAKTLRPAVISELADTFKLKQLQLHTASIWYSLNVPLKDSSGAPISYLSVQSQRPGTESYEFVFGRILGAALLFVAVLALVCIAGYAAVRSAQRNERASKLQAAQDPLTGLFNKVGFCEAVSHELDHRMLDWSICVFDLDGFKTINEVWGSTVGDQVLICMAQRMTDLLPQSALSSRLGGDRFCFLYPSHGDELTKTLLAELSEPCLIGDRTIAISMRAAFVSHEPVPPEELLRRAAIALDHARLLGRGARVTYEPGLDENLASEKALEQDLREALQNHELRIAFQPLVDAKTGQLTGAETLARWFSQKHGVVPPDKFIAIAEKSGLIDELGRQVLEKSLTASKNWPELSISVNVSPSQLRNPHFARSLKTTLDKFQFPPERLVVEITESSLISDTERAKQVLDEIRNMGVRLALDDFGSGFASIGMLKQFDFDCLKLDRSLITALDNDETAGAVLQATAALASTLHLTVTAEGIENEAHATIAMLAGCQQLQGYLFGRPMDAETFAAHYLNSLKLDQVHCMFERKSKLTLKL